MGEAFPHLSDATGFYAALYEGLCDELLSCREFQTRDSCLAVLRATFAVGEASFARGVTLFNAERASECLATFHGSVKCRMSDRSAVIEASSPACDSVSEGTLSLGAGCRTGQECATGSCEFDADACTDACCEGTCGNAARTEEGAPCDVDIGNCGFGAYCTADGVCAAYRNFGEACDGALCFGPMVCTAEGATTPTCRFPALPKTGETCTADCNDRNDYCSADTQRCEPRKEPGEPCLGDEQCVGYATCENDVCTAVLGMACDETVVPSCHNYTCQAGTCVLPEPPVCD